MGVNDKIAGEIRNKKVVVGRYKQAEDALAKVKNAIKTLNIEERPTAREQEVLKLFQTAKEMTSTDYFLK